MRRLILLLLLALPVGVISLSYQSKTEKQLEATTTHELDRTAVQMGRLAKQPSSIVPASSSTVRVFTKEEQDRIEEELIERETTDLISSAEIATQIAQFQSDEERLEDDTGELLPRDNSVIVEAKSPAEEQVPVETTKEQIALFTDEELKELAYTGAVVDASPAGLIPGVHVDRGGSASVVPPPAQSTPPPDEGTESDTEEDLPSLLTGQARGYTMLYLMHPAARATVEAQLQAMLDARARELYLGVLIDGTFGQDFSYFAQVVQRLNTGGRLLTLVAYLTNGSTMRHYRTTPITAGFNRMNPADFRERIKFDPVVRSQFTSIVQDVKPVFDLNTRLNPGNRNIAIVMLEDNLREDSYRAMRELARGVLGNRIEFIRNPCLGCFDGNDAQSAGDPLELHRIEEIPALSPRDGFTLDGLSYNFPGRSGREGLSIAEVRAVGEVLLQRGIRYFGLWRKERQGITEGITIPPDGRRYEVPTEEQLQIEIELLQHGLIEVVSEQ